MNMMKTLRNLPLWIPALIASGFLLSGCNTIEGVGKDVEAVGESIEDAADKKN